GPGRRASLSPAWPSPPWASSPGFPGAPCLGSCTRPRGPATPAARQEPNGSSEPLVRGSRADAAGALIVDGGAGLDDVPVGDAPQPEQHVPVRGGPLRRARVVQG